MLLCTFRSVFACSRELLCVGSCMWLRHKTTLMLVSLACIPEPCRDLLCAIGNLHPSVLITSFHRAMQRVPQVKDLPAIVSAMLVKPIPPALDASGEGLFTTVIPDNRCCPRLQPTWSSAKL